MKKLFYAQFLAAVLFAWTAVVPALASSPWQWEFAMQKMEPKGTMYQPTAVFIDEDAGRYYVVDSGNNRLLSYGREGEFISAFTANSSLETPFDLVREPGFLWVVEKGKNSLTEVDLKAQKINPRQITYKGKEVFPDRLGGHDKILYLLDKASGSILTLDRKMQVQKAFSCKDCTGGFVDFKIRNGNLWALEQIGKSIHRFGLDGTLEETIQLDPDAVEFPRSLEVAENGFIFVLDRHRGTIVVFDVNGQYKYNFFEVGEARGMLYYPIEIEFDPWGKLCVVEEGNGRVQVFRHR